MLTSLSQPDSMKCGMCMALKISAGKGQAPPAIFAGYEDGSLALWSLALRQKPTAIKKLHGEPVMALAVHGKRERFLN